MKSSLAFALFAGLVVGFASSNSTAYYGWAPNKEYVYRFETQVLTGIPNLRDQYAGVKLSSRVIVQSFHDYTLRIQFQEPKYISVNQDLKIVEGRPQIPRPDEELPQELRRPLTTPFVVHLKKGVVESLTVDRSEPAVVTNIKKALLSQLQLDLTASRRKDVLEVQLSNSLEKDGQPPKPLDHSYFTTEESSVAGDCQTSYTVHPIPKHQAMELEKTILKAEKKLVEEGFVRQELSIVDEDVCSGKDYFEITKTKNFDNCKERPTYQSIRGMKINCDFSKSECKELMSQMATSRYIVCGSPKEFYIRQAKTNNDILTNPLGWTVTPEKMTLSSKVSSTLLKVKSGDFQPLPKPSNPSEKRSLVYEFPRNNLWSAQETRAIEAGQETEKRGYQPILPMPDLESGSALVPKFIPTSELKKKIVEEMEKIVREIFQTPESCSSKSDIAGSVHAIAQSLRSRNLRELEEIEQSLEQASFDHDSKKIAKEMWQDILAMTGSNACVTLLKRKLERREIVGYQATRVLQSAIRNVKTPTQELLKSLFDLVKKLRSNDVNDRNVLYNTGIVQLANLVQHACIDPTYRTTQFPVRTYGLFCTRDSEFVVREFVPYLARKADEGEKETDRLVHIAALGKVGDKSVILPLAKLISAESRSRSTAIVRSVAVYALKRAAKLESSVVRPILLKVIDNPADLPEVRIAAISVLPWTQPSTAELQKMAVRSWFEPSNQVAAFMHSTLKSLVETKVPELLPVGQKAKGLLSLVKPFQYGILFSHNMHFQKFVEYLRTASSLETSYVNRAGEKVPARFSVSSQLFGGVWQIDGLTFNLYTSAMDSLVEKIADRLENNQHQPSGHVAEELANLKERLNIKRQDKDDKERLQTLIRYSMLGFHRVYAIDQDQINHIFEKVSEQLRSRISDFDYDGDSQKENRFNLTYTNYAIKVRVMLPSMSGFPVLIRRNMPVVFGIKGDYKWEQSMGVYGTIIPVMNGKLQSSMGVISPFAKKFVGAGVEAAIHSSIPVEGGIKMENGQVDIVVKTPESARKEVEAFHVFVKPFTVVKSLEKLVPLTKSSSLKEIVSGQPLKKMDVPFGRGVGIDARLKIDVDYKRWDFAYVWEKLSQHNPISAVSMIFMPVSSRLASFKIMYNPATSESKELKARFSLIHGKKVEDAETLFPSREDVAEEQEQEIKELCRRKHERSRDVELCEQRMIENLVNRRESHRHAGNMLRNLGSDARVGGLNIHASVNSGDAAVSTTILVGSETESKRQAKTLVDVQIRSRDRPVYELTVEAETKMPEIEYRWDVDRLLQQDVKLQAKVDVKYGKVGSGDKKDIKIESVLYKSEQQKEAVRKSPEMKKCQEEIAKGNGLARVCMEARHQAASVDTLRLKALVPESWKESKAINKIEAALMSYLWPLISSSEKLSGSQEESGKYLRVELDMMVNRTGDVAQIWVANPHSKLHFKNISIPKILRNIMPFSLRNGISTRLVQHLTRNQEPASCRLEDKTIATFDNKTYHYKMERCDHVLLMDCTQHKNGKNPAYSVSAKKSASSEGHKDVTVLTGSNKIQLKWESDNVRILLNGQNMDVAPGQIVKKWGEDKSGKKVVVLLVRRYRGDKVVYLENPQQGLMVFFDGKKLEIVPPRLLNKVACGMCGDYNGENTADLKAAQDCIMKKARFAAYTYMVEKSNGGSECSVPEQDRREYQEDLNECVKTKIIPTKVSKLARRVLSKGLQPVSSTHVVEVRENSVCVSKTMVRVCGKNQRPAKVERVELSFACLPKGLSNTEQILRRALAGEQIVQVREMPTEFSKKQVQPVECKSEGEGASSESDYDQDYWPQQQQHNNQRRFNNNNNNNF